MANTDQPGDEGPGNPQEPGSTWIEGPGEETFQVPSVLPVLPVRDVVIFPGVTVPLAIGRNRSLAALEAAGVDGYLLVVTQIDPATEEPRLEDLHPIGTIVRVVRIIDARRDGKQALVVGIARGHLGESDATEPTLQVSYEPVLEISTLTPETESTWGRVIQLAQRVIDLREDLPEDWKDFIAGIPSPGVLADLIASNLPLSPDDKVQLLKETDATTRLIAVEEHLTREVTIAETQETLRDQAESEELDPQHREQMLRGRMREIQEEIGEGDPGLREVDELREKVDAANLPQEAKEQAERELKRLSAIPQHAPDRHLIRTYLEWLVDLPWSAETEDILDLNHARDVLAADHHGLEKVKDRILEFLAVRKLAPEAKAPILCFVGPPGVGKTSLGRSIARAMGRNFARASLGGVRDEAEIRGHRRTYVGAMPGRILQSLKRAGSRNPIFLLDEIDKLGADFRGDPSSALLEVLDAEQNYAFSDHYVELPFDLSRVLFIATANTLSTIPPALLDRMEVIELPGYTEHEKLVIALQFLVPRQLAAHGLTSDRIDVTEEAVDRIVLEYTREAGVRNLERNIATLMRKAARQLVEDPARNAIRVDADFTATNLGAPPHLPETAERTVSPGVAVGLAVTAHGGDILFIEATRIPGGKGIRMKLTGQLGEVMRESAEAALSWIRAHADRLLLPESALEPQTIHLHIPAGAVPKDGPSAGIALVTCLVSMFTGRHAAGHVAMTGEISLRGRVLPVGGIKGKIFAAVRAGIQTVVMPRRNEKDLVDLPEDILEKVNILLVDRIEEALEITLDDSPTSVPS